MIDTPRGITIVGLGPGDPNTRTIGVQRALDSARRIILRTRVHPGIDDLAGDDRVTDCDELYEQAPGFDWLYSAIADRVIEAAAVEQSVVFAVPGHPRFGERTVRLIEERGHNLGIPVTVLDSVSFIDTLVSVLKIDPVMDGLQIADAEVLAATLDRELFAAGLLGIDPARPLIVAQVYNQDIASAVKIALTRVYPDEQQVTHVRAVGVPGKNDASVFPLHQLDRQDVDHLSSLWIPPLAALDALRSPETLTRIVARLRAPGGCAWDRTQTHTSLRNSVLEEAYEVVDAIDNERSDDLVEELGDLLLLVSMLAQIAEEEGTFRIEDVYEGISRKLIRRHPHVFGDITAETPDAVIATWESVKAQERLADGDRRTSQHPLDRLPRAMPAIRKVIEVMAPRTELMGADDPTVGDNVLTAIRTLLDSDIDPERALEASLRKFADERHDNAQSSMNGNLLTEAGRGRT
ncbi:MAG: MazG family protein [Chloroflexia bacterium]|nr:MazG family protein [Chloroflexia bacterium]